MTSLNISDTPFEIQTINIITSFYVEIINIILFTSATIRVVQYDINLNIVRVDNLTISGEFYTNWTSDEYFNYVG